MPIEPSNAEISRGLSPTPTVNLKAIWLSESVSRYISGDIYFLPDGVWTFFFFYNCKCLSVVTSQETYKCNPSSWRCSKPLRYRHGEASPRGTSDSFAKSCPGGRRDREGWSSTPTLLWHGDLRASLSTPWETAIPPGALQAQIGLNVKKVSWFLHDVLYASRQLYQKWVGDRVRPSKKMHTLSTL